VYDIWNVDRTHTASSDLPLTQRPECTPTRLLCVAPDVIAGQADVLPAERRDVAKQIVVDQKAKFSDGRQGRKREHSSVHIGALAQAV
jgi:hypothetical protein